MALQQYNFFPTDFFYPRPQSSTATFETASGKPTVVPLQTPKAEISSSEDIQLQNKNYQQQPRNMIKVPPPSQALVYTPKRQSPIDKKLSKLSTKPLSWMVWLKEEEGGTF